MAGIGHPHNTGALGHDDLLAAISFVETIGFGAFGGDGMGAMIMLSEVALYVGLSLVPMRSGLVARHCSQAG